MAEKEIPDGDFPKRLSIESPAFISNLHEPSLSPAAMPKQGNTALRTPHNVLGSPAKH